jgi:ABC-2 type transport system permease protein
LLWLIIFGTGVRLSADIGGLTTQQFIFPGIIGQTLLFTSMFMGISVIWDKEFGFMKEILVAPISRMSIFLGKMFGDSVDAVFQGVIVFFLGILIGVNINLVMFLAVLPIMLLTTFGLVSIGLTIASFITDLESFGVIQSFINLPLFFLSGALFPIRGETVPVWLQTASNLNPLTYGVDALRTLILGGGHSLFPLYVDVAVICTFDLVMIIIGTWTFSRMK